MDKCAALSTMLEQQPDKVVFTELGGGLVAVAGVEAEFTHDEVERMLQRRFLRTEAAARGEVEKLRLAHTLSIPVPEAVRASLQKTANTAVVVDMYEVDYTPRTIGESTQAIDKKLDVVNDFVTRYTFPDTVMSDVVVGPREQVLKKNVMNQSSDLPPDTGASTPLEDMGPVPSNSHGTSKHTSRTTNWRTAVADVTQQQAPMAPPAQAPQQPVAPAVDTLPGGLSDGRPDEQFNPTELQRGMRVEREHTSNPQVAKEIAKDHLTEDPRYYLKLQTMEQTASSSSAPPVGEPQGRLDRVVQPGTGMHSAEQGMPHDENYMHVAPSPLGGVGLFAYRPIKAGTVIYRTRPEEDLVLPLEKVRRLPPDQQRLYHTFGVVLEGRSAIVVPKHFNHMSIIWYINHSDTSPNVATADGADYHTTRDVLPGEELLVNYNTFDSDENAY